ncbi:MAG: putative nucleotidyltransferase [Firmicutes bacterium ADurb.BinA205]|nr:MAG: putative nucleotidyltransferase [Firmicutes bacterium ADurb.BinA205]
MSGTAPPIVYKTTPQWEKVRGIIDECFMSKAGVYHYLSTAKHQYKVYLSSDEVKLKKYFYVLRPILACKWILEKGTPPPMLFTELMDAEMEDFIRPEVEKLLEMKMQTPEIGKGRRIEKLHEYIEQQLEDITHRADAMDGEKETEWQKLDEVFYDILGI